MSSSGEEITGNAIFKNLAKVNFGSLRKFNVVLCGLSPLI